MLLTHTVDGRLRQSLFYNQFANFVVVNKFCAQVEAWKSTAMANAMRQQEQIVDQAAALQELEVIDEASLPI